MNLHQMKLKAKVVGAVFAATATLGLGVIATSTPAHADPILPNSLVGMGSDTIQDLMNALSGTPTGNPLTFRLPIHTSARSGSKTITSWDAIDPTTGAAGCIFPKLGGPFIDRPNGSGKGVQALSDAIQGGVAFAPNGQTGACGAQAVGNMSGQIDFARSSAQPSAFPTGTALTWIPLGRDAVGYMAYDHGTGELATMTTSQLQQLFGTGGVANATGTITVGTRTVRACMVQSGSGTGKFWDAAMGNNGTSNPLTSAISANNSGCGSLVEENGANGFLTTISALTTFGTDDFVIPFSTGSLISQLNGYAKDRSSAAVHNATTPVDMGAIDAFGKAYSGTGTGVCCTGTAAPNTTFYASGTGQTTATGFYGRDLFTVIDSNRVAEAAMVSMFEGSTSAVCAQSALILNFGFSAPTSAPGGCGDTTQKTALKP